MIETIRFAAAAVNATSFKNYSTEKVRGRVIAIDTLGNCVGSLWIGESGTDYPIALIDLTSGTVSTFGRVMPRTPTESVAGVALSGAGLTAWEAPFLQGNPIIVSGLGVTSGTTHSIGPVDIHFERF